MKQFLFGSRANNHFHKKSDFDYYDIEKDFDKFQKNLQEHKLIELEIYCRYFSEIPQIQKSFKFDRLKLSEYVSKKCTEDKKRILKEINIGNDEIASKILFQFHKNQILELEILDFFFNHKDSKIFDLNTKLKLNNLYNEIQKDWISYLTNFDL